MVTKENPLIIESKPFFYKSTLYLSRYKLNYLREFEAKYITRTNSPKDFKDRFLTTKENFIKAPIVVLGCSYAYGEYLDKQEAFSGQLSKNTNQPVYNLALAAGSIQHMIYSLNFSYIKEKINTPEYIIYVFISDHVNRLYSSCGYSILDYIFYSDYKNGLKFNKFYSYIQRLPIPFVLNTELTNIQILERNNITLRTNFLKKHINILNNKIHSIWGNTKFIIFVYENCTEFENIADDLKSQGIEIVYLKNILNENNIEYDESFKLPKEIDKFQHPSAKAWQIITPIFINYIKKTEKL